MNLVQSGASAADALAENLRTIDLDDVARTTGVSVDDIMSTARMFVTGHLQQTPLAAAPGELAGAVIHTLAHDYGVSAATEYPDAGAASEACANLSILTGNLGRAGGGVASPRGGANYQGTTDMGMVPDLLPGGRAVSDDQHRSQLESHWQTRWVGQTSTSNGYMQKRSLPTDSGIGSDRMVDAIESGAIKAMWVEGGLRTREVFPNPRLFDALQKLEFLVVADAFDSPLAAIADVVLPASTNLEKDGTFTSFDRTVQRVRVAVPSLGESRSTLEIIADVCDRFGYQLGYGHPAQVMREIATLVPGYGGVSYAHLEREGVVTPVAQPGLDGVRVLDRDSGLNPSDGASI
jgi:predicted molibdopterin-dependent oxidoreductase YjgC